MTPAAKSKADRRKSEPIAVEAWPKKTDPSEMQLAELAKARERGSTRKPELPVQTRVADGKVDIGSTVTDQKLFYDLLCDAAGTWSHEWMNRIIAELGNIPGAGDLAAGAEAVMTGLARRNAENQTPGSNEKLRDRFSPVDAPAVCTVFL